MRTDEVAHFAPSRGAQLTAANANQHLWPGSGDASTAGEVPGHRNLGVHLFRACSQETFSRKDPSSLLETLYSQGYSEQVFAAMRPRIWGHLRPLAFAVNRAHYY